MGTRRFPASLLATSLFVAATLAGCARASHRSAPGPARYTEADVRFMSDMIAHHAQAITISGWAPTHDASPAVRTLAARIIGAQRDEITIITRWLRDRGLPVPEAHAGMHMAHDSSHAGMPGMLSEAQLRELESVRGREFDRLFLTFMILHHRGAMTMVQQLVDTPGGARDQSVFKLASDINVDQATEVARMQRMLADLTFGTVAP